MAGETLVNKLSPRIGGEIFGEFGLKIEDTKLESIDVGQILHCKN